jgi:hypothetical protein
MLPPHKKCFTKRLHHWKMKDKNSSRRRFIEKNLFAASGVILLDGVDCNIATGKHIG